MAAVTDMAMSAADRLIHAAYMAETTPVVTVFADLSGTVTIKRLRPPGE